MDGIFHKLVSSNSLVLAKINIVSYRWQNEVPYTVRWDSMFANRKVESSIPSEAVGFLTDLILPASL
jgi:hypothetical protein